VNTALSYLKHPTLLRQTGMSLIEVLVSLIIFSVGLLGAGGLILSSLRSSQFSASAANAMSLVRDYGELMQVIPAAVISTSADGTSTFMIDTSATLAAPTDCKGASAACTPQQTVNFAIFEWVDRVKKTLPDGRAVVCKDSTPKTVDGYYKWACDDSGDLMVVKFGWRAKSASRTGETQYANDLPKLAIVLFGNQKDFKAP
jgi:type IV pilus assembly protein PilV